MSVMNSQLIHVYSPDDQAVLEAAYKRDAKPDKAARLQLVQQVALGEKEVQVRKIGHQIIELTVLTAYLDLVPESKAELQAKVWETSPTTRDRTIPNGQISDRISIRP